MKTAASPKLSFTLMSVLLGFPMLSETIYTPSLPSIVEGLATNAHWVEYTLSIYFIGLALGISYWGVLADRIGRRPVMLLGILIYLLGTLGCFFSYHIGMLLFFRVIQAIGASVGSVITQTMLRDVLEKDQRNRWFSLMGVSLALAPAMGPFIGGWLDYLFGWRASFITLFILGAVLWIVVKQKLPETLTYTQQQSKSIKVFSLAKKMLLDTKVMGCMILVGTINGALFSFYAEAPFILMENMGMNANQYGWVGLSIALAGMIGASLSHRLLRSYTPEWIMSLGSFLMLIGSTSMVIAAYTGIFSAQSMWLGTFTLLVTMFIMMFGAMGLMIPNLLSIALSEYSMFIGKAGSLFGFAYYLVAAALTALMSQIHNGTVLAMPWYFLALSVLVVIIYRMSLLRLSRNESLATELNDRNKSLRNIVK